MILEVSLFYYLSFLPHTILWLVMINDSFQFGSSPFSMKNILIYASIYIVYNICTFQITWMVILWSVAAAAAKLLQSCPTLCDRLDGSPPSSSVPGILQARTLEWVAISFSNAWKWKWSRSVLSDSSWPHGLQPTRLLCPWDFPGKSTGAGCQCLLHNMTITVLP